MFEAINLKYINKHQIESQVLKNAWFLQLSSTQWETVAATIPK